MKSKDLINTKNWFYTLKDSFFTFGSEIKQEDTAEIIEISDCEITGMKQAIIMLDRHHTEVLYIKDILTNNELMKRLSPDAVRALTYLIVIEQQASKTQIQDLKLTNMIDDFIISLRPKDKKKGIGQVLPKLDDNSELIRQYNYLYAKKIYREY